MLAAFFFAFSSHFAKLTVCSGPKSTLGMECLLINQLTLSEVHCV